MVQGWREGLPQLRGVWGAPFPTQLGMDPSWQLAGCGMVPGLWEGAVPDPNPVPQPLFPAQCTGTDPDADSCRLPPLCQWCPVTPISSHGEIQLRLAWRNPAHPAQLPRAAIFLLPAR